MTDEKPPPLIDQVKIGDPPLSDARRKQVAEMRDKAATGNLMMIQRMNAMGIQVDVGMESISFLRRFMQEIGLFTEDQRLAAEAMWEIEFHESLRMSLRQIAEQQQAAQQASGLIKPNASGKLIIPGQG